MLAFLLRLAEGRQINMAQKLGRFMQGQAHDAGKTARQSLDEHGAEALDRIGASLVAGLAGSPIGVNFIGGDSSKADVADAQRGPMVCPVTQGYRAE